MPQITLEYTSNIKGVEHIKTLMISIHKIIESQCSLNINNCKSRINRIEDFVIGDGDSNKKFLHLEVKLFEGRSHEIISSLGNSLIDLLRKHELLALQNNLDITIHIVDIEKSKYFKFISE
jgi:5-carboxymethyl-2-hydroxymuconate isomerase